ncbi:NAD(P)-binding protein [Pseudohyphozyma bogoriensis]|nr:NAD(P)-binding protein [Pseudohyphozyma bogoriensis]
MPPASFNAATTAVEAAKHYAAEILGKTVLITGGSPGGLGAEVARAISQQDPKLVVLAGRSQAKLDDTKASILKETPSAKLQTLLVDFASLASVRQAAKEVNAYPFPIDVLMLNHSIMAAPYSVTEDGFESHFAVNHLGPFLFTNLIKPRILASKEPRIVVVSSGATRVMNVDFNDPGFDGGKTYAPIKGYGQSKTANIQFAVGLAKRWPEVTSFSIHPGASLETNLARHMSKEAQIQIGFLLSDGTPNPAHNYKTLEANSSTHIVAGFDPDVKVQSGALLANCQLNTTIAPDYAMDQDNADKFEASPVHLPPLSPRGNAVKRGPIGVPIVRRAVDPNHAIKKRSTNSVPLAAADWAYHALLSVGTPATDILDLVLETAVQDVSCVNCVTTGALYVPSNSSTANITTIPVDLEYGIGFDIGVAVSDVVSFGGFNATQTLAACNNNSEFSGIPSVTGLLGLAWEALSVTNSTPFVQQLWTSGQLDSPMFGLGFSQDTATETTNDDPLVSGGYLTLGGTNSSLYTGNITWHTAQPVGTAGYAWWMIQLTGVSVGGVNLGFNTTYAMIDSGTNGINLPTSVLPTFYAQIPGSAYDSDLEKYTFPCDSNTTVTFTFDGVDYPLQAVDLSMGPLDSTNTTCVGSVHDGGDGPTATIVGSRFMESYYSAFRFDPPAVGFAPIANTAALESAPAPTVAGEAAAQSTSTGSGAKTGAANNMVANGMLAVSAVLGATWLISA